MEGTSVVDPDHYLPAIGDIRDTRVRRKRHGGMGGRHLVHIIGLAGGCGLTMEFLAIPAAAAALLQRSLIGERHIALAKHHIWLIAPFGIRLYLWHRIRDMQQALGRTVTRSIILVISAASGP